MSPNSPHPLAVELIGCVSGTRILELGSGRGRNTNALREAGFEVEAIGDDRLLAAPSFGENLFDGALSTHGFLHGTPEQIAELVMQTTRALKRGAPMFATFASTRDVRYGQGTRVAENTYAPASGDERGVPHVYYDRLLLQALLEGRFTIDTLEEVNVDALVGRWAHTQMPKGTVHWFARMRKPN